MTATPGPDPVLLVGVDVGTSAVKAGAVRPDGTLVAVASRPTPPLDGPADALVATALSVVRDTVDATGAARVAAVGVAGMAETGVPLDADLRPLGPLVAWTDRRSAVDADAIAARLGAAEVYAITGLTPGPKRPLTTWHRLRRTAPGVLDRMRVWAHAVELAAFGLTGVVATEASLAARTMAYDIVARCWHDALLAEAGLDPGRLPPVVPPGAAVGTVTP
ncbi:MAG TPA: FGGY family carbohydrate kinase, partial [Mycobacteriales bacterium]|nr:FGGY family carbohydrate kinase [Mycobacteriales bacterium]